MQLLELEKEVLKLLRENPGIDINDWTIHAPYLEQMVNDGLVTMITGKVKDEEVVRYFHHETPISVELYKDGWAVFSKSSGDQLVSSPGYKVEITKNPLIRT